MKDEQFSWDASTLQERNVLCEERNRKKLSGMKPFLDFSYWNFRNSRLLPINFISQYITQKWLDGITIISTKIYGGFISHLPSMLPNQRTPQVPVPHPFHVCLWINQVTSPKSWKQIICNIPNHKTRRELMDWDSLLC